MWKNIKAAKKIKHVPSCVKKKYREKTASKSKFVFFCLALLNEHLDRATNLLLERIVREMENK